MDTVLQILGYSALLFVAVTVYAVAEACYYQRHLGTALKRDLGFSDGAAYRFNGRWWHESAVSVESVVEGGAFDRAGFRVGDVLPDVSHSSLFKSLHRRRGRVAELAVVDGGEGPSFERRPRRTIRIAVPARNGGPHRPA